MSAQRLVRLKAEMDMMTKNPVPGIHCWLKESNSEIIMVEMDGPSGSPYESGVFQLEVVLSDRYPFTPPLIRFITPIYHPNIDDSGRICLNALKPKPSGSWAVNLNIATVLSAIRILLSEPNLSDPLMADISKQYSENHEAFRQHAEAETLKHAKKISSIVGSSSAPGKRSQSTKTVGKDAASEINCTKSAKENEGAASAENVSKKPRLE